MNQLRSTQSCPVCGWQQGGWKNADEPTQKFEAKVSTIEESCDLKKLTIFEMVSKLHAHELRFSMRLYDVIEGTFQARHKGKQPIQKDQNNQQCKRGGDQKEKANKMGVQPNLYQGTIFLLALHAKGQTTCLKIVDIRGSLKFNVTIARTADIKRGTTDLRKINLTHNLAHQVNLTNEQSKAWKHFFMATQANSLGSKDVWYVDSGCTNNMARDSSFFTSLDKAIKTRVKLENGEIVQVEGRGIVSIQLAKVLNLFMMFCWLNIWIRICYVLLS